MTFRMKPILVFALNAREASQWANEEGLAVNEWLYVHNSRQLMGVDGHRHFIHPRFYERSYREVNEMLQVMKTRNLVPYK